jgi:hypothetical protein
MIPIVCGGNRAGFCSKPPSGRLGPLRQIRTMTADMVERKLNCIGWPVRHSGGRRLWTPAGTPSGWGFSFL